ncbi:hypothetical protein NHG68_15375 [Enterobacter sp. Z1]|uniref:hypothetical protein n=1 Tax=Enterobacter sp. Z1 TaxID=2561927 RepID=UPI0011DFB13E|nr:hypothetical protein [Enterobacter sp. Z1]TYD05512.1 hypothetical protein E4M14_009680 [Enterobacter sp. Z1]USX30389.1 hypothetical protein NHG68_15375 [Enterobacter sp. Z1]
MDESRKAFESWLIENDHRIDKDQFGKYVFSYAATTWVGWQASREALNIELTPACWRTYYPDTDEHQYKAHSESGPESCARRIASEIGGYVVPIYHGKPQNCAAGTKVKE